METELTKKLKKAIHNYRAIMPTKMRTVRYADEVWTPTGIVDSIRFEDVPVEESDRCFRLERNDICKYGGQYRTCGNYCKGCVYHTHSVTKTGICVTCFECKISLTDFKSPHGHNFCGNRNYYVVPKDLAQTIKDLVPDDIGIIAYYGNNRLRKIKECKYQEISDELKCGLLYDALKKWCDGKQSKI